jgi:chromosome partitioning protein
MVIGITNLKGGVGKSTISQNLAVGLVLKGYKVCVLDTDTEQRSSMKWAGLREANFPHISVVGIEGEQINKEAKYQEQNHDIVIIDGSPQLAKAQTKTLTASDILLIPLSPSSLDFWSMEQFLERYEQVKEAKGDSIEAYIILNKVTGKTNLEREVLGELEQMQVGILETRLVDRIAYREAPINGLGVMEFRDAKAKDEISRLTDEIESIIHRFNNKFAK